MISIADCVCRETKNKMRNIIKVGIVRLLFIAFTVGDILLLQTRASRPDDHNLSVCEKFTRNKEINNRIETGQKFAAPCACAEKQMALDSSFQKMDRCYVQWFFENGVKQQCCYNEFGALQLGAPDGGYLLVEEVDMTRIKESCCTNTTSCHVFYGINQSNNCSTYIPFETVTSWGDPTIQTIDGAEYEFNGHGEYVFLKTSDLEIQARTEYATANNIDATAFSAFALFHEENDEQIEFHYDKTAEDVFVYRNGEKYCNAKRDDGIDAPHPCTPSPKYKCMILAGGRKVLLQGCSIGKFARQIEISIAGKFIKLVIVKSPMKDIDSMNLSGLAGKLQNGDLLGRHGSQVNVNATSNAIFDLSETWKLQNENESIFFYNITGGNYTVYNGHHTVPRFLETLVGNLTELFKNFSSENITLFNKTCRNYWNNDPNKQCLLTIARTKDYSLGLDVMAEANETRRVWEILHNEAPKFLDGMPRNITAIFNKGLNFWMIDLKEYVSDDTDTQLTYGIQTHLPKEEYSLDNGVFNWTIGTGLRHIDSRFIFFATDRLNSTATHEISVQYCGCDQPSECNFEISHSKTTGEHLQKASCDCLHYHEGDFCEIFGDPCENGILECYNKHCNAKVSKADTSGSSWPCSPCPAGLHGQLVSNKQNCEDIDECATTDHKCHQVCNNTQGSYKCACTTGYDLHSNGLNCSDVDECTDDKLCGQTEVCVNTIGSYKCNCVPGYMREEGSESCLPIVGKTYVATISFTVITTQDGMDDTMINTEENRNSIQDELKKRYQNVTDFVSVKVVKLSLTSKNSTRRRSADEGRSFDAQYILYWKSQTNTTIIEDILDNAVLEGSNDNLLKPDALIPGLRLISEDSNSVNIDICSIPGETDCDLSSTTCENMEGGYQCHCLTGYESPAYSKKYCTEIDECALFVKDNSIKDRCVHGSCVNVPGSWKCTCPEDRLLQSVGNDTLLTYRCQGNYSYIGTVKLNLMSANPSEEEIKFFVINQLSMAFRNKSFSEEADHDVHISSLFVHTTLLTLEEDKSAADHIPHGSYKIMFNLRLGELVDTVRLTNVLKLLSERRHLHINNRSDVYFQDYHIFTDSENILCNFTSYGGCDEVTTTCHQQNGTTDCRCKTGYDKRYETDKFCRGVCKDLPCENGGTCYMVNDDEDKFECICAEGWTGSTCQDEYKKQPESRETGTNAKNHETAFIATGSTLGGIVLILLIVVLIVCRWKGSKDKEETALSKRYLDTDGFKPFEGSDIDEQNSDNTNNFYNETFSESGSRQFQEMKQFSHYDRDKNGDTTPNVEGNRASLQPEIERQPSPSPDHNKPPTNNIDRDGVSTNSNRRSGHLDESGALTRL